VNDRLYRSRNERMLAGVAGGVAERFDLDPSLVRVLWFVLVFLSGGIFLLLYIAMALVVPEAPEGADRWAAWGTPSTPGPGAVPGWGSTAGSPPAAQAFASVTPPASEGPTGSDTPPESDAPPPGFVPPPPPPSGPGSWVVPPSPGDRPRHRRGGSGGGAVIAGIVLVLIGGYFLLRTVVPQVDLGAFWPLVLVGIGVALLVGSIRPGSGGSRVD
jgi:phage shock protein C